MKKLITSLLVLAFVVAGFAAVANAQGYQFTKNLKLGDTSSDVKMLQQVLNSDVATQVSVSGAGSPGNESTYFGAKTRAAVIAYQKKYGITPASGFFGPITRAKVNAGGAVVTNPGTTNPGTSVPTVAGALQVATVAQPMNSLAPQSASRVPFTKVALTAGTTDVTVNSITVERAGLAQDAVFSGIVLLDENGIQLGISKTLNSNHQVTIGEPMVVKAGTTKVVTVAGNMSSDLSTYAGQVAALNVVSVNSNGTVTGTLPVMGAAHTINASLSLGSATAQIASIDPNGAQTKEIGTTGQRFAGIRLTAGSVEKVRLWSVRWNQSGSVSSNDLGNIKVNIGGIDYPTVVSADGKYYTATFGSGIVIDKGLSTDMYIWGDIVGSGASNRTVQFDLYKNTDLYITGETYGYGIIASPSSTASAGAGSQFTTSTPFFDGSTVTISAGSVSTIARASTVPAQFVAVNVPNQVLGGFQTDIKGEPISVQSLRFTIATSSTGAGYITNVSIVDDNGAVVAGPVDASGTGTTLTFSDTVTLPVGKKVYTLKGQLPSGYTNGGTVTITATPSTWSNITGQVTGNSISFSALSNVAMNPVTVKAASLALTISSQPSSQTIVAGTTGRVMANYQFDATQSGEDVRFSSVQLTLGGSGTASKLTGCQLFDGATALNSGSNVVTGASTATFTFDQALTIAKGTVKVLALKCNIDSSATGTFIWGVTTSASNPTITGVNSSNTVYVNGASYAALTGPTLTMGSSGSLAVSEGASKPLYGIVAGGTSDNVIGVLSLRATNEDVRVEKLGLALTGVAGDLAQNGAHVRIKDGNTVVGSVYFTSSVTGSVATSTLTSDVVVAKDTDKVLTLVADFAPINSTSGNPGKLVKVNFNSLQGKGIDSGSTVEGSGSTSFAGLRTQKSYPIFTYSTASGTAQNGTNDLMILNVQAPASGDVLLNKLTFSVSTTTATASTFTFVGPNGNVSSSSPILNAAGTTLTVYLDSNSNTSDRIVPAGGTRTFTLRTSNLSLTGTNSTGSISVALKADTAAPSLTGTYLMASTTVSGLIGQNVLWSPISTTSSSNATITLDDWTNGYGLPGCFKDAGLGTDCTARSVTK